MTTTETVWRRWLLSCWLAAVSAFVVLSLLAKKGAQHRPAFLLEHARRDGRDVVKGMRRHVQQLYVRGDGSQPEIGRPVHQVRHAKGLCGRQAHGTRFQRGVERRRRCGVVVAAHGRRKSPVADRLRRRSQGEQFGVGGRVAQRFHAVVLGGENLKDVLLAGY